MGKQMLDNCYMGIHGDTFELERIDVRRENGCIVLIFIPALDPYDNEICVSMEKADFDELYKTLSLLMD